MFSAYKLKGDGADRMLQVVIRVIDLKTKIIIGMHYN